MFELYSLSCLAPELPVDRLLVFLHLVLVLERMLLMLGFSKVVLSEDEGALLGLTQVSHIF